MNTNNDLLPRIHRGKFAFPNVGDRIYVPSIRTPLCHVIGGLGTVDTAEQYGALTSRRVTVAELPGVRFVWGDLRHQQFELWNKFQAQIARFPTEEERKAFRDEVLAKEQAAEAAERAKHEPKKFLVVNRGLLETPVWGTHARSRNWAAVITVDPVRAGGIQRKWFNRGSGPSRFVIPSTLDVHDAVEFGADYVRVSGFRDEERWYGVVLEVAPTHLLIQPYADVITALKVSIEHQQAKAK